MYEAFFESENIENPFKNILDTKECNQFRTSYEEERFQLNRKLAELESELESFRNQPVSPKTVIKREKAFQSLRIARRNKNSVSEEFQNKLDDPNTDWKAEALTYASRFMGWLVTLGDQPIYGEKIQAFFESLEEGVNQLDAASFWRNLASTYKSYVEAFYDNSKEDEVLEIVVYPYYYNFLTSFLNASNVVDIVELFATLSRQTESINRELENLKNRAANAVNKYKILCAHESIGDRSGLEEQVYRNLRCQRETEILLYRFLRQAIEIAATRRNTETRSDRSQDSPFKYGCLVDVYTGFVKFRALLNCIFLNSNNICKFHCSG